MPPPVNLEDLVITNPATVSNVMDFTVSPNSFVRSIVIQSPGSLTGAITVEVRPVGSSVFTVLRSGAVDIALVVSRAEPLIDIAFGALRLSTTITPGASETFKVSGREDSLR